MMTVNLLTTHNVPTGPGLHYRQSQALLHLQNAVKEGKGKNKFSCERPSLTYNWHVTTTYLWKRHSDEIRLIYDSCHPKTFTKLLLPKFCLMHNILVQTLFGHNLWCTLQKANMDAVLFVSAAVSPAPFFSTSASGEHHTSTWAGHWCMADMETKTIM